jgi:hypothetical protein
MIFCGPGSGSDFGKSFGSGSGSGSGSRQNLFSTVFQQQKFLTKSFSMSESAFYPESWPLNFDFLTVLFHFILDPHTNPVPVPLRQEVPVPIPQH